MLIRVSGPKPNVNKISEGSSKHTCLNTLKIFGEKVLTALERQTLVFLASISTA